MTDEEMPDLRSALVTVSTDKSSRSFGIRPSS